MARPTSRPPAWAGHLVAVAAAVCLVAHQLAHQLAPGPSHPYAAGHVGAS